MNDHYKYKCCVRASVCVMCINNQGKTLSYIIFWNMGGTDVSQQRNRIHKIQYKKQTGNKRGICPYTSQGLVHLCVLRSLQNRSVWKSASRKADLEIKIDIARTTFMILWYCSNITLLLYEYAKYNIYNSGH